MSGAINQISCYTIPVIVSGDTKQSIGDQVQAVVKLQVPCNSIQEVDGDAGAARDIVPLPLQSSCTRIQINKQRDDFLRTICVDLNSNSNNNKHVQRIFDHSDFVDACGGGEQTGSEYHLTPTA